MRIGAFCGIVLMLVASGAGCGDDTSVEPPTSNDASDADVSLDADGAVDAADAVTDADAGGEDAADGGDADAGKLGYLEPCSDDDECESGYCIEGHDGRVCTADCTDDEDVCGDDWVCDAVEGDADLELCFPDTDTLCTSCAGDGDCGVAGDGCLDLVDGESCGRSCEVRRCPDGYSCSVVETADGDTSLQCVPDEDVCSDCYDPDGDGYGVGDGCAGDDCDQDDASIHEDATEACNGVDDDCDGEVDEGCDCVDGETQSCYSGPSETSGVGTCEEGTQTCEDGSWGDCEDEVVPVSGDEACDGEDDDCDGVVDEGCACDYDGNSDGVCSDGTIDDDGNCTAPSEYESDESSCDGFDNDCDGVVDEGCQCDYDSTSEGVCSGGTIDSSGTCTAPSDYESDETSCDGLDNDCDGNVDEGCNCVDGDTQNCGTDVGQCQEGTQTCSGGSWGSCQGAVDPTSESCDGVDNDCDGVVDEGCSCDYNSTSTGVCSDGTIDSSGSCSAPSDYESDESSCDGVDNDCDGTVDEGCPCDYDGTSTGVCSDGTIDSSGSCQAPSDYESDESTCDGLDNDCDGTVDEAAVDQDSSVTTTSACLTRGTDAESAVVVELNDQDGDPITGASVSMSTSAGTISSVSSSGNTYWATLTAPAASGVNDATVTVDVTDPCTGSSTTLNTEPVVAFAAPFDDTDGGAGGCSAQGNVRARVVDDSGSALSNAHVMIGDSEQTSIYTESYNASPTGDNHATTDSNGYVEFHDYDNELDGPLTVTAAYEGSDSNGDPVDYHYATYVDVDASDFVLPVSRVYPDVDTGEYEGDLTNISNTGGGDAEFGLMLPDMDLETLMAFDLDALLGKDECYSAAGQDIEVPRNTYIPDQTAAYSFFTVTLNEKDYTSAPIEYGSRNLWGIVGDAPLDSATSGFDALLQDLDMQQLGVDKGVNVDSAGPTTRDIDMNRDLNDNVDCNISNYPGASDVFCLTLGDWDSASDSDLTTAMGDLFLMGLSVDDASNYTGSFTLDDVTSVGDTGDFADIEYFGASVALYLDDSKSGIPADTENGASIILDRTTGDFDDSGGTLNFDDYIPIRPLSRSGRDFTATANTGSSHPTEHYTRSMFQQAVTETYDPCGDGDNEHTRYYNLWTVYTPASTNTFTLPDPPSGWPRAGNAAPYEGLIDPSTTSEDDEINWLHMTIHEGLTSSFDYDALQLASLLESGTHASLNNLDF